MPEHHDTDTDAETARIAKAISHVIPMTTAPIFINGHLASAYCTFDKIRQLELGCAEEP